MSAIELAQGYRPFDKQAEFHASRKRFRVVAAGNRGGKTRAGAAEFICSVFRDLASGKGSTPAGYGRMRSPRLLYWVVTPTHDLGQWPFEEILRFLPPEAIVSIDQANRTIWAIGDIKIEFKTAERPERLVGAKVYGLWIDEACRVKAEAWRGSLRARLADVEGWAIFTSSPLGGRDNWVYRSLVSQGGTDEHVASFHWTTAENPYIPRSEVEHARATIAPQFFKRDWEANWDSFGGAVYESFRDEQHVTSEDRFRFEFGIPRSRPLRDVFNRIVSAIDFGFVAPGCMLTIGELGEGNWVVLDEVYGPGIRPISGSERTWLAECQRVSREYGVRQFIADPEDAGAIFDLRNNGISVEAAKKQVYMGIRRVASALMLRNGKPGLRIFDKCKNLIREMRNYQWKPNREQTGFLEEPDDNQDDHACDALRYAAMELKLYDYVQQQRQNPNARPLG